MTEKYVSQLYSSVANAARCGFDFEKRATQLLREIGLNKHDRVLTMGDKIGSSAMSPFSVENPVEVFVYIPAGAELQVARKLMGIQTEQDPQLDGILAGNAGWKEYFTEQRRRAEEYVKSIQIEDTLPNAYFDVAVMPDEIRNLEELKDRFTKLMRLRPGGFVKWAISPSLYAGDNNKSRNFHYLHNEYIQQVATRAAQLLEGKSRSFRKPVLDKATLHDATVGFDHIVLPAISQYVSLEAVQANLPAIVRRLVYSDNSAQRTSAMIRRAIKETPSRLYDGDNKYTLEYSVISMRR